MGPAIIIPVIVLAVVVPITFAWARKTFKDRPTATDGGDATPAGGRLTSNALRDLPVPTWRVVYEIATDKLGGVEHVVIGPPGVFALQTSMEPVPALPTEPTDAHAVARVAALRGDLDDALGRCAMSCDRLVRVHWGVGTEGSPDSVEVFPGLTAVDGRAIATWMTSLEDASLTGSQVDLAWQTVTTTIGRPDPLT